MTTPQDVFAQMPEHFLPDKAKGVNVVIQFDLSGENGGQWYLTVADGTCRIDKGRADAPAVTISMADSDYVAMSTGAANAIQLFMSGKIKLEGNMMLAQSMQAWFDQN